MWRLWNGALLPYIAIVYILHHICQTMKTSENKISTYRTSLNGDIYTYASNILAPLLLDNGKLLDWPKFVNLIQKPELLSDRNDNIEFFVKVLCNRNVIQNNPNNFKIPPFTSQTCIDSLLNSERFIAIVLEKSEIIFHQLLQTILNKNLNSRLSSRSQQLIYWFYLEREGVDYGFIGPTLLENISIKEKIEIISSSAEFRNKLKSKITALLKPILSIKQKTPFDFDNDATTLGGELVCTKNSTSEIVDYVLDSDFSIDEKLWYSYLKKLTDKQNAQQVQINPDLFEKKVYVLLEIKSKTNFEQLSMSVKSIESLATYSKIQLQTLFLFSDFSSKGLSLGNDIVISSVLGSLNQVANILTSQDFIIFIEAGDIIQPELIFNIKQYAGFESKITLFDMFYKEGSKIYPLALPGINKIHAKHINYFFSRFGCSGDALISFKNKFESLNKTELAKSIITDSNSSDCAHIDIPSIEINISKETIEKMRMDYKSANKQKHYFIKTSNISVVICTKERPYLLENLVNNLIKIEQVFEIIIVANDVVNTLAVLSLEKLSQYKKVKIIDYEGPFNFSRQCNQGVKNTSAPFLLFLNDDLITINESWLNYLYSWFNNEPPNTARIIGPMFIYPNETVQHAGMYLGFHGTAGHILRFADTDTGDYGFLLTAPRNVSCLTGGALLMRRSSFIELGGFDEFLATCLQDVDLCLRAIDCNYQLILDPRAIMIHCESLTVSKYVTNPDFGNRSHEHEYFNKKWRDKLFNDVFHSRIFHPHDESLQSLSLF